MKMYSFSLYLSMAKMLSFRGRLLGNTPKFSFFPLQQKYGSAALSLFLPGKKLFPLSGRAQSAIMGA